MNSHFLKRLVNRTLANESPVTITPAMKPVVVPELFLFPNQQYTPPSASGSTQSDPPRLNPPESIIRGETEYLSSPKNQMREKKAAMGETDNETSNSKSLNIHRKKAGIRSEKSEPTMLPKIKVSFPSAIASKAAPQALHSPSAKKPEYAPESKVLSIKQEERTVPTPLSKEEITGSHIAVFKDESVVEIEKQTMSKVTQKSTQVSVQKNEIKLEKAYTEPVSTSGKSQKTINAVNFSASRNPEVTPTETAIVEKPVNEDRQLSLDVPPKTHERISSEEWAKRSQPLSEPTVTIHIGRIEVHAVMPQKPIAQARMPVLSLKEYLKQRSEES